MKKLTLLFYILFQTLAYGQDTIIKDIDLIPMNENILIKKQSVLLKDGKIAQIDAFEKLPKTTHTRVIDGQGKYLMPGLADMHVHLPVTEKVDTTLLLNLAAGVTRIRVMNSQTSQSALKQRLDADSKSRGPKVYYSYIIRRDDTFTEEQLDSLMVAVKKEKIDFIKLFGMPNESAFGRIMQAANKHNIIVGGHYPAYQQDGKFHMLEMEKVLGSNFRSIEHLAGYSWLPDDEKLTTAVELTKTHQVYNCPTLDWDVMANHLQFPDAYKERLTYAFHPKYNQRWEQNYEAAINEEGGKEQILSQRAKSLADFERKKKILKMLYEYDCLLLMGGDAGGDFQADGFNMYEEMLHWQQAGIDNYTILKSATLTPAMFFHEQDQWGTIEVGKDADLVILSKNPLEDIRNINTVESTILRGKMYHKADLLKEL